MLSRMMVFVTAAVFSVQTCYAAPAADVRTAKAVQEALAEYRKHTHFSDLWAKVAPNFNEKSRRFLEQKTHPFMKEKLPIAALQGQEVHLKQANEESLAFELNLDSGLFRINQTDVKLPSDGDYEAFWNRVESAMPKAHSSFHFLISDAYAMNMVIIGLVALVIVGLVISFDEKNTMAGALKACEDFKSERVVREGPRTTGDKDKLAELYKKLQASERATKVKCSNSTDHTELCDASRKFLSCMKDASARFSQLIPVSTMATPLATPKAAPAN